jgi:ribosomal protein S18 acetylase RimI-like enzyme
MGGPQISTLDADRLSDLEPLWRSLHRHHRRVSELPVLADDDLSWQRRRDWYGSMLDVGDAFALVAREGDAAVGYAFVSIRPGDDDTWPVGSHMAELVSLAVASESRGGGVGTALMDAVDAELDRRGVRDLQVAVMAGNARAQRFYERRGLRVGEVLLYRFGSSGAGAA